MKTKRQCAFIMPDHHRCRAFSLHGSSYCFSHDPAKKEEKMAAVTKGGLVRDIVVPEPLRPIVIEKPRDVVLLITATILEVRSGELDPRVANTIGYLAGQLLRAFEYSDMAQRVEALESAIKSKGHQ